MIILIIEHTNVFYYGLLLYSCFATTVTYLSLIILISYNKSCFNAIGFEDINNCWIYVYRKSPRVLRSCQNFPILLHPKSLDLLQTCWFCQSQLQRKCLSLYQVLQLCHPPLHRLLPCRPRRSYRLTKNLSRREFQAVDIKRRKAAKEKTAKPKAKRKKVPLPDPSIVRITRFEFFH